MRKHNNTKKHNGYFDIYSLGFIYKVFKNIRPLPLGLNGHINKNVFVLFCLYTNIDIEISEDSMHFPPKKLTFSEGTSLHKKTQLRYSKFRFY